MKLWHKKTGFFLSILVLTGMLFAGYSLYEKKYDRPESRFGYPVVHSSLTENIDFYEFSSLNEHLEISEIHKIKQNIADQLVQEKVMLFSSLFKRQRVGYKGQHTEFIDCPDAYKPKYHETLANSRHLRYFTGYANDRFVFGSCDRENSEYYAVNAYLYCSNSARLLDIRYFITVASAKSVQPFIAKLTCENID